MATGIRISELPEHLNNIEVNDWLPFVDSSGSETRKISPYTLFNNISAVKTSNWVLKETLEFDNEIVDGSSINIKGNNIDRIMIIAEMYNANGDVNISLKLNNDDSNNYSCLYHNGGDSHGSTTFTQNQMYLVNCDSGGTGVGRHYLYPKVNGTRRVCEGMRTWLRNNSSDFIQNQSYFWGNTVDEITFLDFNSGNITVTGKISIYEWKDLQVTDLHSYELIDEINLDNEILDKSISIKGNQEDEIKIVAEMYNAISDTYINLLLNNDNSNNYTYLCHYGGDSHGGYKQTFNQISSSLCDPGGTGIGRWYLYPKVNNTRRICEGQWSYIRNGSADNILNDSYFWENTVDEITSLDFDSNNIAITGKIRIYKNVKLKKPLSMNVFLHIQDQKLQGTDGGTFNANEWQTRDLNTILTNTIPEASLSNNQITLPTGKYYVKINAPAYRVTYNKSKLINVTNSTDLIKGTSSYSNETNGTECNSLCNGEFILDSPSTIELQHKCSTTNNDNGFGIASSIDSEVYSDIRIWQINNTI